MDGSRPSGWAFEGDFVAAAVSRTSRRGRCCWSTGSADRGPIRRWRRGSIGPIRTAPSARGRRQGAGMGAHSPRLGLPGCSTARHRRVSGPGRSISPSSARPHCSRSWSGGAAGFVSIRRRRPAHGQNLLVEVTNPEKVLFPGRRDHQGRPRRVLREGGAAHGGPRQGTAAHPGAVSKRDRRAGVLPEERGRLLPRVDRSGCSSRRKTERWSTRWQTTERGWCIWPTRER